MRTIHFILSLILIQAGFSAATNSASAQKNTSNRRMTEAQIRSVVEKAQDQMSKESDINQRKAQMQELIKVLEAEFNKGSAAYDKTFVYVNKVLLDAEHLLYNDCKKSRNLIENKTLGQDPNMSIRDRTSKEISEGTALHTSYCPR